MVEMDSPWLSRIPPVSRRIVPLFVSLKYFKILSDGSTVSSKLT
jgi:hypothetical protein